MSMTTTHAGADPAHALLAHLALPRGTAVVMRRRTPSGPQLVVRVSPSVRLPADRKPAEFAGMPVVYERLVPAKAL